MDCKSYNLTKFINESKSQIITLDESQFFKPGLYVLDLKSTFKNEAYKIIIK